MRRLALLMTVILLLVLPSCGASDEFKGGRPITKEDLESVSASLFTTAAEPEDEQTATPPTDTVYWLTTGSVYHLDPNCSHIAGKENVNQTSVQEAEANGRRLCKTCEKKRQGE